MPVNTQLLYEFLKLKARGYYCTKAPSVDWK